MLQQIKKKKTVQKEDRCYSCVIIFNNYSPKAK